MSTKDYLLGFICIYLFIFNYGCAGLNTYYMDNLCDKTLKLSAIGLGAAVLRLTKHSEYESTMNCVTTIMSSEDRHIMLKYTQMDIKSYDDCPGDYLAVYDGIHIPGERPVKEPVSQFCGDDVPRLTITSTDNYLTLRFVSDNQSHGEGFEVVLTAFHNDSCNDGEFQCNNKRCISDMLVCNGYDNCGDYSDWCVLSAAVISGIVIACFVAIVTIWVCMVFVWYAYTYRRQRSYRRSRRRSRTPIAPLNVPDPRYSHLIPSETTPHRRDVFTIFPQLRISITPIQPPPYPGEPNSVDSFNTHHNPVPIPVP